MQGKKITILFDANPIANARKSGVGYYTLGTITALAKAYPDQLELVGHYFNFLGRNSSTALPTAPNITYVESRLIHPKVLSLLRRFGLQLPFKRLIKRPGDIAFFPNFVSLPLLPNIPSIVTIHDLTYIEHPEFMQPHNQAYLQNFVPPSLMRASLIVAVSEATKQSIIKHYSIDANKIIVTPIPVAPMPHGQPQPKLINGKYILFVSTLEPRKNFITLVKAYCALPPETKKEYSLVLAGQEGWGVADDLAEVKRLQQSGEKIVTTGYIDEPTRAALYEHAALFVMPSFSEGFGMPLLEAMSFNVPVIASDIPVFREVAGTAALYADPNNAATFTAAIQNTLDTKVLGELRSASQTQLQKFRWEKVAADLFAAITRVLGNRSK